MADVIDLDSKREEKTYAQNEQAYRAGAMFRCIPYAFNDDDVGLVDGDQPILFLYDPSENDGIVMTRDTAFKLANSLLEACASPFLHK